MAHSADKVGYLRLEKLVDMSNVLFSLKSASPGHKASSVALGSSGCYFGGLGGWLIQQV